MIDRKVLEELGLNVKVSDGVIEAELELSGGMAVNPLTRQFIAKAQFTVVGDRLITIFPAELVGMPPINLAHVQRAAVLEDILVKSLNDAIMHVQRRSQQLTALGISPKVDPTSLQLSAELTVDRWVFTIGTDRLGNFRVMRAANAGSEMTTSSAHGFELSEFRERGSLENYLVAMFGDVKARPPPKPKTDPGVKSSRATDVATEPSSGSVAPAEIPVYFKDLLAAFGPMATVPARSNIEILIELQVDNEQYRFAAARVSGKTFRGLLAGANGKLWADRFELNEFPGITKLLAMLLGVAETKVQVL